LSPTEHGGATDYREYKPPFFKYVTIKHLMIIHVFTKFFFTGQHKRNFSGSNGLIYCCRPALTNHNPSFLYISLHSLKWKRLIEENVFTGKRASGIPMLENNGFIVFSDKYKLFDKIYHPPEGEWGSANGN